MNIIPEASITPRMDEFQQTFSMMNEYRRAYSIMYGYIVDQERSPKDIVDRRFISGHGKHIHPSIVVGAALARGETSYIDELMKSHRYIRSFGLVAIGALLCPDREYASEFVKKYEPLMYPNDLQALSSEFVDLARYINWELLPKILDYSIAATEHFEDDYIELPGEPKMSARPWQLNQVHYLEEARRKALEH